MTETDTDTAAPRGIFARVRDLLTSSKRDAMTTFWAIVARIRTGRERNSDAEALAAAMRELGRTPDDAEEALALLADLESAEAAESRVDGLEAAHREANIAASDAATQFEELVAEARQHVATAERERASALAALQATRSESKRAPGIRSKLRAAGWAGDGSTTEELAEQAERARVRADLERRLAQAERELATYAASMPMVPPTEGTVSPHEEGCRLRERRVAEIKADLASMAEAEAVS
jgi:hypothetical protein